MEAGAHATAAAVGPADEDPPTPPQCGRSVGLGLDAVSHGLALADDPDGAPSVRDSDLDSGVRGVRRECAPPLYPCRSPLSRGRGVRPRALRRPAPARRCFRSAPPAAPVRPSPRRPRAPRARRTSRRRARTRPRCRRCCAPPRWRARAAPRPRRAAPAAMTSRLSSKRWSWARCAAGASRCWKRAWGCPTRSSRCLSRRQVAVWAGASRRGWPPRRRCAGRQERCALTGVSLKCSLALPSIAWLRARGRRRPTHPAWRVVWRSAGARLLALCPQVCSPGVLASPGALQVLSRCSPGALQVLAWCARLVSAGVLAAARPGACAP